MLSGRLPQLPSYFEILTALAFLYFAENKIDIAVLEVGMGGRLDATNVVNPLLSIVTDISLDHMEWLGPTITDIAREKAGILRRGGTMITLPQHPEANEILGEVAIELDVRGVSAVPYVPAAGTSGPYSVEVPQALEPLELDRSRLAAGRGSPAAQRGPRHRRRSRACRAPRIPHHARRNRERNSPHPLAGTPRTHLESHLRKRRTQTKSTKKTSTGSSTLPTTRPAHGRCAQASAGSLKLTRRACSSLVVCATSLSARCRRFYFLFLTR